MNMSMPMPMPRPGMDPKSGSVPKTGALPSANTADYIKALRIAYNTFVDQKNISGVGAGVQLKLEFLKEQFVRIIPDRLERSRREDGKGKNSQQAAGRFVEKIKPSFVSWGMDKEFRELAEAAVRFATRVVPPEPSAPPLEELEESLEEPGPRVGYVYPIPNPPGGASPVYAKPISPGTPQGPPVASPSLVKPDSKTLVEAEVQAKLDILSHPSADRVDKEHAVAGLYDLSRDKDYGDALIKAGVGTPLVGILSGDATEQAKDYAAKALLNLLSDPTNLELLVKAGVYAEFEKLNRELAEKAVRLAAIVVVPVEPSAPPPGGASPVYAKPISPGTPQGPPVASPSLVKPDSKTLVEAEVQAKLDSLSHPSADRVDKEYAVAGLYDLSRDKDYGDALLKDGVGTQLIGILVDQQATPRAKEFAAGAICNLARNDAVSTKLIKAGVGTPLVGILSGDATAQAKDYAAKALLNLSSDKAQRTALVDAGVYAELEKLINNLNAEPSARDYARGAVLNFLNDRLPPVSDPKTPEFSPMNAAGAIVRGVTGVAGNAFGTVKEALGTVQGVVVEALGTAKGGAENLQNVGIDVAKNALETAQKGVTAGFEAVKKWLPF